MTKVKTFYTARYDRVFKTVLCDEDNKEMFQEFLSRLLKKKVEIIEFLRNELPISTTLEKVKTVDVLVKVDGEYIHIEINGSCPSYLHIRNYIYFSTLFSKKVQRGEKYDMVTKFMHIDLTYGMKKDSECIEYYVQSEKGDKYLENIKIMEYNMDKIMKYWYDKNIQKVNEYKHLIMLDLNSKDLDKLSVGDDFVEKFNEKITDLNEQETFQSAMTYEQDQRLILNTEKSISFDEGVEKGIAQGSKERNIEIAKKLLDLNISKENILAATGLNVDKITDLNERETFQSAMTYEQDQRLILNTEKSISFDEGVEKGIAQGSKERNIEIAKSMLKENIPVQLIVKCTGLSVNEITNL